MKAPPSPHSGHRERLRERFLKGGAEAMPDYEMLELVLFAALPRRDTKPLAKAWNRRGYTSGNAKSKSNRSMPFELFATLGTIRFNPFSWRCLDYPSFQGHLSRAMICNLLEGFQ
jgi:hypothetical protein